jgi:hypothetical protein
MQNTDKKELQSVSLCITFLVFLRWRNRPNLLQSRAYSKPTLGTEMQKKFQVAEAQELFQKLPFVACFRLQSHSHPQQVEQRIST